MGILNKKEENIFEMTSEHMPKTTMRTWLIGRPLATADAPHQTIGKLVGLAVFSSDALSSVAYGPQEIMAVMILAGMGPVDTLQTAGGKLFAGCYAIYSGIALLTSVGLMFAPLVHRFLHRFHLETQ